MANKKKHFVVLGLGTFGRSLALQLSKNGCRVTGVDRDKVRVESLKNDLYEAIVADVTERAALEQLDLPDADTVFVGLGEGGDMSPSLLAVLHARELGARRLVVKGLGIEHERILRSLGVDRVVFPEAEIAVELADRATWPNVLDYLPIDSEHSVVEMAVAESLIGQTLREADLRRRHGIFVVALKDALSGKLQVFPDPETEFSGDEVLIVLGSNEELEKFRSQM